MPEYNNAAGRLLAVMERLPNSKNVKYEEFAALLGVSNSWSSVLTAVDDLQNEFATLLSDIEQIKDNAPKYQLYKRNLPDIRKFVTSFILDLGNGHCSCQISPTGLVAIRFIAADLAQDEDADQNDLNCIREIVSELQKAIEASSEFSKSVKEWLLDLVRIIRDSLDRFAIRGSRGMRKQFSLLLGELMQNYDIAKNVQETEGSIWQRFTSAIDLMNKLATLAEHCRTAVPFAQKLLPLLKTLGLPTPDDLPVDNES